MKKELKKLLDFLKSDSWVSLVVVLLIALVLILYVLFPILEFVTGTSLPMVIVESCSMHHEELGFERVFSSPVYGNNKIALDDTAEWAFQRGLNKGDIIFVVGAKDIKKGDVIIFAGGSTHPIIHRVVDDVLPYATKGDNYITNSGQLPSEVSISDNQILGKAIFRIPSIGWVKLIFFDWRGGSPGLC